ncbi:MAG: helix-turn-helix transcriptional regulator [Kordiimonadaceae bacterium]|nr:helix-turn-helix transcriptional regulator [Kordiimonadaceae bacterium]
MLVPRNDERYQTLRDAMVAARKAKGLHQSQLATKLGVSQQFISKLETGERLLTIVEAIDLAHILGIDLNDLIAKLSASTSS